MAVRGARELDRQLRELQVIEKKSTAAALNKVAVTARSAVAKAVSSEVRIPQKHIRKRILIFKAGRNQTPPKAKLKIKSRDIPAINLATRNKETGALRIRAQSTKATATRTRLGGITAGGKFYRGGFLVMRPKGRENPQIFRRVGKSRHPIEVIKLPTKKSINKHFNARITDVWRKRLPIEYARIYTHNLRRSSI